MKLLPKRILLGILLTGCALTNARSAQPPAMPFLSSPDHPPAWYVSAKKLDQRLRWSPKEQSLVADIVYARDSTADGWHTARCHLFTVHFPGVHLAGNDLYVTGGKGKNIVFARRGEGPFGEQINLEDGYNLHVQKRDGILYAEISAKGVPQ